MAIQKTFFQTFVFYIIFSKYKLNRQIGLYNSVNGYNKPIQRYTVATTQVNINYSTSTKTNEIFIFS